MEFLIPILFLTGFVIMVLLFGFLSHKGEQKRQEKLRKIAENLGLKYSVEGESELFQPFGASKLFNRGRSRRIRNVIAGETEEVSIFLFDYYFTTGSGKRRRTHRQTVACLRSPRFDLPHFTMRPQSAVFDRIGKSLGGQDIDFDDYPEFSRMFVLQGEEMEIRRTFDDSVLRFFEKHSGLSVEGWEYGMLLYRHNRTVPPAGMRELLSQAYEVFAILTDRVA